MTKRASIAYFLVLCVFMQPGITLGAESAPNTAQAARQLFASMKTAAKTTANKMAGLDEVAPRVPYRSALAVDAATGKVLYQDNADVKAHPASCTKMMTLLLVLEDLHAGRYALSDTVKASAYAATFRGSSLGIKADEAITVEDLLYALMIRSANDGAVVLAEHSAGNVRAFVDRMNRRAQELGMTNTRYVSPNGMTPYHNQACPGFDVSTATDLSKLARHLVTMPEMFKYTACPRRTIAMGDKKDVSLVAHNYFLPGTTDPQKFATPVPGCDGLKTGFTDAAGASIVLTAQRDGRRVVAVVLGCANRLTRETAATCILRTALDAK